MPKISFRVLFVLLALTAILVVTSLPVGAHTLTSSQTAQTPMSGTLHQGVAPQCAHLKVNLQGAKPATWNCLDKTNSQGHMIPFVAVSDCSANTLIVYADSNESGWTICFYGDGWTNMTEYCGPAPYGCLWNWNDQASSYRTGCDGDDPQFFADINGEGTEQEVGGNHQSGNFDGNPLNNDTLSSLHLSSCL